LTIETLGGGRIGSKPQVDVVIPTYNRRDLLQLAVSSIRAQTLRVERIIIVDDGSTDGTNEWVQCEAQGDSRIVHVKMQHGGANLARNAGIANARADWIAFLDSDDVWEPEKLAQQFALLERRPDLIGLFCGFRLVGISDDLRHIPRDDPSLLDLRCANALGSTSSAVIRADALRLVKGFNPALSSCQDWDLWFRLRQIGRLGVVRGPLVRFNCGPHERITTNLQKVLAGHRIMFARLLEGVVGADRKRILAQHKLVEADIKRRFGDYDAALKLIARSFVQAPSKRALAVGWRTGRGAWRDRSSLAAVSS
jgi:glycosyltransferase involved in cell wall biosynthesis